jgi:hypothetical protein
MSEGPKHHLSTIAQETGFGRKLVGLRSGLCAVVTFVIRAVRVLGGEGFQAPPGQLWVPGCDVILWGTCGISVGTQPME